MKKRMILPTLLISSLAITPFMGLAMEQELSMEEQSFMEQETTKEETLEKLRKFKQIKDDADLFAEIFAGLFGFGSVYSSISKQIDLLMEIINEIDKGGTFTRERIIKITKLFQESQKANELMKDEMKVLINNLIKPMKWLSPFITGPLKLFGKKYITKTVIELDESDPNNPKQIKKQIKIPIKKVIEEIPDMISNRIFKLIQKQQTFINQMVEKILEVNKKLEEKIKEREGSIIPKEKPFMEEIQQPKEEQFPLELEEEFSTEKKGPLEQLQLEEETIY